MEPIEIQSTQNVRDTQLVMLLHNFCIDHTDIIVRGLLSEEDEQKLQEFLSNISHRRGRSVSGDIASKQSKALLRYEI